MPHTQDDSYEPRCRVRLLVVDEPDRAYSVNLRQCVKSRKDKQILTCWSLKKHLQKKFQVCDIVVMDSFSKTIPDNKLLLPNQFDQKTLIAKASVLSHNKSLPSAVVAPVTTSNFLRETHVDMTPAPSAVTKGGEFIYFSTNNRSVIPFALAELSDNSLTAVRWNPDKQIIRIGFFNDVVSVYDNGCGMDTQGLEAMVTYALSPAWRGISYSSIESVESKFLNGDISRFGVGCKNAGFYIANTMSIVTKQLNDEQVSVITIGDDEMRKKYIEDKKSAYYGKVYHGDINTLFDERPELYGLSDHPELKKISAMLLKHGVKNCQFSLVILHDLKLPRKIEIQERMSDICEELSQIYHYYIEGLPYASSHMFKNLKMSFLTLAPNGISFIENSLAQSYWRNVLQYQASAFHFYLRVPFPIENASTTATSITTSKQVIVMGSLYYLPFIDGRETLLPRSSHDLSKSDNDMNDNGSLTAPHHAQYDTVFECYWQGRLIAYPGKLSPVFMSIFYSKKSEVSNLAHRLKGVLFFGGEWPVQSNKMSFTNVGPLMDDNVQFVADHYDPIKDRAINPIRSKSNSFETNKDKLKRWILKSHKDFDKEFTFADKIPTPVRNEYVGYKSMQYNTRYILAGDFVATKNLVIIQVIVFLIPRTSRLSIAQELNTITCSGGKVEAFVHNGLEQSENNKWEKKIYPLHRIDKEINEAQIKTLREKFEEKNKQKFPKFLECDFVHRVPRGLQRAGVEFPSSFVFVLSKKNGKKRDERQFTLRTEPNKKTRLRVRQEFILDSLLVYRVPTDSEVGKDNGFQSRFCKRAGNMVVKFHVVNEGFSDIQQQFSFTVVPLPPSELRQVLKSVSSNRHAKLLSNVALADFDSDGIVVDQISMGCVQSLSTPFRLVDKFGNGCSPDDIIGRIEFSHPSFVVDNVVVKSSKPPSGSLAPYNKRNLTADHGDASHRLRSASSTGWFKISSITVTCKTKAVQQGHLVVVFDAKYRRLQRADDDDDDDDDDGVELVHLGSFRIEVTAGEAVGLTVCGDAPQDLIIQNDDFLPALNFHFIDDANNLTNKIPSEFTQNLLLDVCMEAKDTHPSFEIWLNHKLSIPLECIRGLISIHANTLRVCADSPFTKFTSPQSSRKFRHCVIRIRDKLNHFPSIVFEFKLIACNHLANFKLCLTETDTRNISSCEATHNCIAGETIHPFLILFRETGEVIDQPYSDQIISGVKLNLSWYSPKSNNKSSSNDNITLSRDGTLPHYTIPTRIDKQKLHLQVDMQLERLVNTITIKRGLKLSPGEPKQWNMSLTHTSNNSAFTHTHTHTQNIKCGTPLGDSLHVWLEDHFQNQLTGPISEMPQLSITNEAQRCDNFFPSLKKQSGSSYFVFPKAIIIGRIGPLELVVKSASFAEKKFQYEMIAGDGHHLMIEMGNRPASSHMNIEAVARFRDNIRIAVQDIGDNTLSYPPVVMMAKNMKMRLTNTKECLSETLHLCEGSATTSHDITFVASSSITPASINIRVKSSRKASSQVINAACINIMLHPFRHQVVSIQNAAKSHKTVYTTGEIFPVITIECINEINEVIVIDNDMLRNISVDMFDTQRNSMSTSFSSPTLCDNSRSVSISSLDADRILTECGSYQFIFTHTESRPNVRNLLSAKEITVKKQIVIDVKADIAAKLLLVSAPLGVCVMQANGRVTIGNDLQFRVADQYDNHTNHVFSNHVIDTIAMRINPSTHVHIDTTHPPIYYLREGGQVLLMDSAQVYVDNTLLSGEMEFHLKACVDGKELQAIVPLVFATSANEIRLREKSRQLKDSIKNSVCSREKLLKLIGEKRNGTEHMKKELSKLEKKCDCDILQNSNCFERMANIKNALNQSQRELRNIHLRSTSAPAYMLKPHAKDIPGLKGFLGELISTTSEVNCRVVSQILGRRMSSALVTHRLTGSIANAVNNLAIDGLNPCRLIRPMPHIGTQIQVTGNPRRVADQIRPAHNLSQDSILFQRVFNQLISDAIIMDDQQSANLYRKLITQTLRKTCPTIYCIRESTIIQNTGFSGGNTNTLKSYRELRENNGVIAYEYCDIHLKQRTQMLVYELQRMLELYEHINAAAIEIDHLQGQLETIDAMVNQEQEKLATMNAETDATGRKFNRSRVSVANSNSRRINFYRQ